MLHWIWRGRSGRKFRFDVKFTGRNLPDAAGVYIFVRRKALFLVTPLYVGSASGLRESLRSHELWPQAWWMHGATERHLLLLPSEEERDGTARDLVERLRPVLNRKALARRRSASPERPAT